MNKRNVGYLVMAMALSLVLLGLVGCRPGEGPPSDTAPRVDRPAPKPAVERPAPTGAEQGEIEMQIVSEAFDYGQPLPDKYAHEHENLSPALKWTGVPEDAVELALICDDPDAPRGTFTHWLIWGLSAERTTLPEGVEPKPTLPNLDGAKQGTNDFGDIGHGGPQPPRGTTHRYFFRLYALRAKLELPAGAGSRQVRAALEGKVLAEAETMATYSR